MANRKTLGGPEPTQTQSEGINISNSSTKPKGRPRVNTRASKARKTEVDIPAWGEKHQVWIWRSGGSGTFLLPATRTVNVPNDQGKSVPDKILYSEGANEVLMSEMRDWNEKPVKTPIKMHNSMLHVPKENVTLQKYLTHLVYYGGFNDIYLDDPEAEAMKEAERYDLIDANVNALGEMDVVELRSAANSMMVGVDAITPKRAVIARLRKKNEENPQELSKVIADDGSTIYFICDEIVANGFVDVNNGTMVWEDGSSICQVPANQQPSTFLAMQILNDATVRKNWLAKFKEALIEHYPE